jgi:hypothetical protein
MASDGEAGREARAELQTLFGKHVGQLLRLALSNNDNKAKKWAGMILANITGSISKHDKKLSETNAYLAEKKKISSQKQLVQVLFPKPMSAVVQRELKTAERYRNALKLRQVAFGKGWKEAARRANIPEAYWIFAELPVFSQKSEPQWWRPLWPLIRENNPDLLRKLRRGEFPTRGKRYQSRWASYRKEVRYVLDTIARLRDSGVL